MDSKIYYIPEHKTVSITSNYSEIKKWMDLGIHPKVEYIPITISELSQYEINSVGFDKIDNNYFQTIKELFSKLNLTSVAFHESTLDLSDVIIAAQELFIGEKSKINILAKNFENLKEVTFLSVKTFKGKVLDTFESVKKLTVWDNTKTSTLPEMFPNITELIVNKRSLTELDLTKNKNLEKLEIHYCSKLEQILLPENHKLKEVVIENCKNLDVTNLPTKINLYE